jgi:hypothetical protein
MEALIWTAAVAVTIRVGRVVNTAVGTKLRPRFALNSHQPRRAYAVDV